MQTKYIRTITTVLSPLWSKEAALKLINSQKVKEVIQDKSENPWPCHSSHHNCDDYNQNHTANSWLRPSSTLLFLGQPQGGEDQVIRSH